MKVPSHLAGLYLRSVRRYRKLTSRLRKETNTDGYTYRSLSGKLKKLRRKLEQLHVQLKLATASGILVLSLTLNTAQAQTTTNGPFDPQPRHINPLREPFKFDGTTFPATIDLDKDGDYDLLVGDEGNYYYSYYGYNNIDPLRYLLNVGTNAEPKFEEKHGEENPFNDLEIVNRYRGPVFADIDKDGDQDLFVGTRNWDGGQILYFKNDDGLFKEQTTAWDPLAKTGNPFQDITLTDNIKLSFSDLDNDSDLDAVIAGQAYDYATGNWRYVHYYKNDGQGTFTEANAELTLSPLPEESDLNPTFADVDKDGDVDLVFGGYYLGLRYYNQVTPGNFVEETGPYDPLAGTGNPFNGIYEPNTQPVFADLDNDSDLDLLLGDGDGDHYYAYPNNIIHYFENTGSSVFEKRPDLANSLGGVDVKREASPLLVDLDADGDLDALIGHKYENYYMGYNTPVHYKFDQGEFRRLSDEESPFGPIGVYGPLTPAIGDIDDDGDLDLVSGDYYGQVNLFRNNEGIYELDAVSNPFDGIDVGSRSSTELADMDGDGDLDLAVGSGYGSQIHYFENTGDKQLPLFEERLASENPFDGVGTISTFRGHLHLADVDHDGDQDLLATESYYYNDNAINKISYYENTGTSTAPILELSDFQPFVPKDPPSGSDAPTRLQPYLADQDQDGDLDLFVGNYNGVIQYVKNENPSVAATVASSALTYRVGEDGQIHIDPTTALSDEDNDLVVLATVGITNYQQGDELHFTPQTGISGTFNAANGILSFRGKATLAEYQTLLRTVTYHFHNDSEGGRKAPLKKLTVSKSIEFRIYDTDFTNPQLAARNVNVVFNSPPVLANSTETTQSGNSVTIDLNDLMSDPDDNLDLSTLRVVQQPSSGATATIDTNNRLIVDYDGVEFSGSDNITIEVCDDLGACAQNLITIQVENSGKIEVFNAVAPNSGGDNQFMRIRNLPEGNKVTIFNRWGDKVFDIENYDSSIISRRFEGRNNNGKALPSGTYFYKIEIKARPNTQAPSLITGYLSLKQ